MMLKSPGIIVGDYRSPVLGKMRYRQMANSVRFEMGKRGLVGPRSPIDGVQRILTVDSQRGMGNSVVGRAGWRKISLFINADSAQILTPHNPARNKDLGARLHGSKAKER